MPGEMCATLEQSQQLVTNPIGSWGVLLGRYITKHSSALYIGMAKVLPIIDVLSYDGQNSSFSSSL